MVKRKFRVGDIILIDPFDYDDDYADQYAGEHGIVKEIGDKYDEDDACIKVQLDQTGVKDIRDEIGSNKEIKARAKAQKDTTVKISDTMVEDLMPRELKLLVGAEKDLDNIGTMA